MFQRSIVSIFRVEEHAEEALIGVISKCSEFLASEWRCIVFPVRYVLNLYMLCRRK
jgi:hypothetical protein